MQIVNKTLKCSICGCISLPDATKCPKCGTHYKSQQVNKNYKEIYNNIRYCLGTGLDYTNITTQYYPNINTLQDRVRLRIIVIVPDTIAPNTIDQF